MVRPPGAGRHLAFVTNVRDMRRVRRMRDDRKERRDDGGPQDRGGGTGDRVAGCNGRGLGHHGRDTHRRCGAGTFGQYDCHRCDPGGADHRVRTGVRRTFQPRRQPVDVGAPALCPPVSRCPMSRHRSRADGHAHRARHVRARGFAGLSACAATGPSQWFSEGVGDVRAAAHDPRRVAGTPRRCPDAGRALYHRRVLVYRLDVVRQPGRRHRAQPARTHSRASGPSICRDSLRRNWWGRRWPAMALARWLFARRPKGVHAP